MSPKTNYPISMWRSLPAARQELAERHAQVFDFYKTGMGPALRLMNQALETSICMNSMMMDICRHFFWYPPGLEYWFDVQQKGYADWIEYVGGQWIKLMLPCVDRRQFTRPVPEPTPEEAIEELKEQEEGFEAVVGAYDDEILA